MPAQSFTNTNKIIQLNYIFFYCHVFLIHRRIKDKIVGPSNRGSHSRRKGGAGGDPALGAVN